jgi:MGT family glycosyltransferase
MTADSPTIVFFPEGAYGPTNNCVGIGDVLRRRGCRVVFVIEESFAGTLEAKGFEESLMRLGPKPPVEEAPGQFWKDFIRDTAPEFRRPTIEQLETFLAPTWQALVDGAKYVNPRLTEIIEEIRPDVIVEDNVVAFAALPASAIPWVRIVSCNPLEVKDPALPPVFSGYRSDDRSGWEEFWHEYDRVLGPVGADLDEFLRAHGAPSLPPREFIHQSPHLNLFVYPGAADYSRSTPLGETWHGLDSSVRGTEEPFELPDSIRDGGGRLVYLSLGSLGSADVELMTRLLGLLGQSDHRVIVSMGPQHHLLRLGDNMLGAEFLPQTSILPMVDVVITHGGNNTVTECFHFGKPMIALPLFWDQYDNAQRVHELGFGVRLDTYRFDDEELLSAIDRLAGDLPLAARMGRIAARLQAAPGTVKAADLIERLGLRKG